MKKFRFAEAQPRVGIDGNKMPKSPDVPELWTHFEFLCGRLADPAFAKGKEGLEAITFAVTARLELERQKDEAAARGWWILEDDRAEGLQRASLNPAHAYNLFLAVPISQLAEPLRHLEPAE